MVRRGNAFQVLKSVVERIAISIMDVTALWNRAKRHLPDHAMQSSATARKIALHRRQTIPMPVEILHEGIKDDWISESVCRSLANLHPLTVKNLCSGVHLTVYPSSNVTATSGAPRRVILGFSYGFQPHGVNTSPRCGRYCI